jgi:hypothetical protein
MERFYDDSDLISSDMQIAKSSGFYETVLLCGVLSVGHELLISSSMYCSSWRQRK